MKNTYYAVVREDGKLMTKSTRNMSYAIYRTRKLAEQRINSMNKETAWRRQEFEYLRVEEVYFN